MLSYNREKYTPEAIGSVLNQSFRDFELIIVDDGSRDNSKRIIADYQAKDERIVAIFHRKNCGIAKAFNDGVSRAQGKFLALMDSDDVWVSSKLEKQLAILKQNEDLIVWSEGEIIDRHSKPIGVTYTQWVNSSGRKKSGDILEELLRGNFIFLSSIVFNAENVTNFKFDEHIKYVNDNLLVVDLARNHEFFFIEDPLAKYRLHGENIGLMDQSQWTKEEIIMDRYFLGKYDQNISRTTKAYLLFSTGLAYSRLGENAVARKYVLRAINVNICRDSLPRMGAYLGILAAEGSFIAKFLRELYLAVDPLLKQIGNRLAQVPLFSSEWRTRAKAHRLLLDKVVGK